MAVRDPWRRLIGQGVAWAAGVSPAEGEQAVAIAEDVRAKVAAGAEVVRRLRGRAPRAGGLPSRAARASAPRELADSQVIVAEVVSDAPAADAVRVEVVVESGGGELPAPSARSSRYA